MSVITKMPTEEEAKRIAASVFIDYFDSSKYDIKDYKCVIILGRENQLDELINGIPMGGQCIFIPFLEEEREQVDNRVIPHVAYLYYGLKQFIFGNGDNSLTKALKQPLPGSSFADDLIIPILTLGHVLSYDMADENSLATLFYRPKNIAEVQTQPLEEISKSLIKNNNAVCFSFLEDGIIMNCGDLDEYSAADFLELIYKCNVLSVTEAHL